MQTSLPLYEATGVRATLTDEEFCPGLNPIRLHFGETVYYMTEEEADQTVKALTDALIAYGARQGAKGEGR